MKENVVEEHSGIQSWLRLTWLNFSFVAIGVDKYNLMDERLKKITYTLPERVRLSLSLRDKTGFPEWAK